MRLLLNAEPFGFGPTAAIASFFPHLRDHFNEIAYIGKHHTLDLQRNLPYDVVYDVSDVDKSDYTEKLLSTLSDYDVFLSAMDHKMVRLAQQAGLKTFYYDALTWYWKDIPETVKNVDSYIAQDFFGVKERINKDFVGIKNITIVPPIIKTMPKETNKDITLINLGGLQNPYWPIDDIVNYATAIITALRTIIPDDEKIIIASSNIIAERLSHLGVKTYDRATMQNILQQSKVAFMTSGLGNIYDAACHDLPTVWLPPANDSQGQQLDLLKAHKMYDGAISWSDLSNSPEPKYKEEQISVLNQIASLSKKISRDSHVKNKLMTASKKAYEDICDRDKSQTSKLIALFGTNGDRYVADHIIKKTQEWTCNNV